MGRAAEPVAAVGFIGAYFVPARPPCTRFSLSDG